MQHFLKTNPQHFQDLRLSGGQCCSIRKDDRNFKEGDEVILMEYNTATERATGATLVRLITHIQRGFGLKDGFVALSFDERGVS